MNSLIYHELKQKTVDYTPYELVGELSFEEVIDVARQMLNNEEWDEILQVYAASLLEELRKECPKEWNATWKYDALLGYAYDIVLNYDERYNSLKRAFEKAASPPPELLVAIAGCCWAPGKPPITEEESITLVKLAIKDTPYIEAIELLKGLYKSLNNVKEQEYWEKVLEDVKATGKHLPSLDQV